LTGSGEDGGMARADRTWPVPRLTAFAWWWFATRVALPLLATTLVLDVAFG
jgi:hypothetical protein